MGHLRDSGCRGDAKRLLRQRPHRRLMVRSQTASPQIQEDRPGPTCLRRIHSFSLDMSWPPAPIIPERRWHTLFASNAGAITVEEQSPTAQHETRPVIGPGGISTSFEEQQKALAIGIENQSGKRGLAVRHRRTDGSQLFCERVVSPTSEPAGVHRIHGCRVGSILKPPSDRRLLPSVMLSVAIAE